MADYDFSKAENIISIDADFLSDWQGGGYSAGYTKTRVPDKSNNKKMLRPKCLRNSSRSPLSPTDTSRS